MLLLTPVESPSDPQGLNGHWQWALTDDHQTVSRHGLCATGEWPTQTESALVVPAWRLSWHRVALPKVGANRLRAALEGLLEEHLLEDPAPLHMALAPGVRAGQATPVWVAVVQRDWLQQALQALQAAGQTVTRILPAYAPQATPTLQVCARDDGHWWLACGPDGVLALASDGQTHAVPPLMETWLNAQTGSDRRAPIALADAPSLALTERLWPDLRWQLEPAASGALWALQQGWNLAQFDLRLTDQRSIGRRLLRAVQPLAKEPQWRAARWGLGALLLVQLIGLNGLAWHERRALREEQVEMQRLLTTTFPQVNVVLDAPLQMQRELERLRQAQGGLGSGDLESLLQTVASRDRTPSIQRLEFSPGQAQWNGWAPAAEQRAELEADLRNRGWSVRVDGGQWQLRQGERP